MLPSAFETKREDCLDMQDITRLLLMMKGLEEK
jgi:hypothetical protein